MLVEITFKLLLHEDESMVLFDWVLPGGLPSQILDDTSWDRCSDEMIGGWRRPVNRMKEKHAVLQYLQPGSKKLEDKKISHEPAFFAVFYGR